MIRHAKILISINEDTGNIRITTVQQDLNKYELVFGLEKLLHHLMKESYDNSILIRKKEEDEDDLRKL